MADRIGVIRKGEIILVEDKVELMRKLGRKQLVLHLAHALDRIPPQLASYHLELANTAEPISSTRIGRRARRHRRAPRTSTMAG